MPPIVGARRFAAPRRRFPPYLVLAFFAPKAAQKKTAPRWGKQLAPPIALRQAGDVAASGAACRYLGSMLAPAVTACRGRRWCSESTYEEGCAFRIHCAWPWVRDRMGARDGCKRRSSRAVGARAHQGFEPGSGCRAFAQRRTRRATPPGRGRLGDRGLHGSRRRKDPGARHGACAKTGEARHPCLLYTSPSPRD